MSKLLINGCSYTTNWVPVSNLLGEQLGFTETTCIGISGSSNDRIFRTTLDYILNHSVDFVILSLTFWDRQEAPWGKNEDWTDYSIHGVMRELETLQYPLEFYVDYIKSRYKYDIGPKYIDKFIDNIIIFSGMLDSMNIRYLMFSAPYENLTIDPIKLAYINKNPRIIDLKNWSSNQYMHDNGGTSDEIGAPSYLHYDSKSYTILNSFLYKYITENNL